MRVILRSIECHEKLESLILYLFFAEFNFINLIADPADDGLFSIT